MKKLFSFTLVVFFIGCFFSQTASNYEKSGFAKFNSGDFRGSAADFTKIIQLNPRHSGAYFMRGLSKKKLYDYPGAMVDYTKAIELELKKSNSDMKFCAKIYANRAGIKEDVKDLIGAIKDYDKAIEFDTDYASLYVLRGKNKFAVGDKKGACLDWSIAHNLGDRDANNVYLIHGCD